MVGVEELTGMCPRKGNHVRTNLDIIINTHYYSNIIRTHAGQLLLLLDRYASRIITTLPLKYYKKKATLNLGYTKA